MSNSDHITLHKTSAQKEIMLRTEKIQSLIYTPKGRKEEKEIIQPHDQKLKSRGVVLGSSSTEADGEKEEKKKSSHLK